MTGDPYLWEYRRHKGRAVAFVVPAFMGVIAAAGALVLGGRVPLWISVVVISLVVILAVWVLAALIRAVTVVHRDHILIRTAFWTKRVAWSDVQGLQIERIPSAEQHDLPQWVVALYDSDGRRFWLPHLNERELGKVGDELYALRDLWEEQRGQSWTAAPGIADKMAATTRKTSEYELTSGTLASYAGGCSACLVMGLFSVVAFGTDVLDGVSVDLVTYLLFGTFPTAFLIVYVTSVVRRRRRRR
ncbi:hypothetical protein [Streptomyces sp. NPDC096193]|uniref:hypothetical protein n=1 Tax=Streptomyces sp. NPDC096193 TaxID=3155821 RepID=UPI00331E8302